MNDNGPPAAVRSQLLRRYDAWIARAEAENTPESRARMHQRILERGRIEAWMQRPRGMLWIGVRPELYEPAKTPAD